MTKTIRQLTEKTTWDDTDAMEMETSGNLPRYIVKSNMVASTTSAGVAELATAAETTTGTDAARVITPDGLAGSLHGKRSIIVVPLDINTSLAVKDGVGDVYVMVPDSMDGMNIIAVYADVATVSSSGTPTIQISRNRSGSWGDTLSTRITIDINERSSRTAAAAAVIDGANDDLVKGDWLRIDCDVAGTGTKGLMVEITGQLP